VAEIVIRLIFSVMFPIVDAPIALDRMIRLMTPVVSLVALALYVVLTTRSSLFTLFSPRGGIVSLGISLAMANVAVWLSHQRHRPVSQRFQFFAAAWIWILVQLGGILYYLIDPA
jgi:hypothetical protein